MDAACGTNPCVLDLAGGTGSITLRLLDRLPDATAVILDQDPAVLRIATGTFGDDDRVQIVTADPARRHGGPVSTAISTRC